MRILILILLNFLLCDIYIKLIDYKNGMPFVVFILIFLIVIVAK